MIYFRLTGFVFLSFFCVCLAIRSVLCDLFVLILFFVLVVIDDYDERQVILIFFLSFF